MATDVFRPGGVSYLRIPGDPATLGAFYAAVFGWSTGEANRGTWRFVDGTGHVIGHFVADREPARAGGLVPYVYVDGIDPALERARANGGQVVTARYVEGDLWVATLRDPSGNEIGVWQRIPEVRSTLAPWLFVSDGARAVAFYDAALGARVLERIDDEWGTPAVANLAVDGAGFWIQQRPEAAPARMVLTVVDPDASVARAVAAGASVVAEVHEEHGWRVGRVVDPFGHHWELARRL